MAARYPEDSPNFSSSESDHDQEPQRDSSPSDAWTDIEREREQLHQREKKKLSKEKRKAKRLEARGSRLSLENKTLKKKVNTFPATKATIWGARDRL